MNLGENGIQGSLRRSDWDIYLCLIIHARDVLSRFEFYNVTNQGACTLHVLNSGSVVLVEGMSTLKPKTCQLCPVYLFMWRRCVMPARTLR